MEAGGGASALRLRVRTHGAHSFLVYQGIDVYLCEADGASSDRHRVPRSCLGQECPTRVFSMCARRLVSGFGRCHAGMYDGVYDGSSRRMAGEGGCSNWEQLGAGSQEGVEASGHQSAGDK